MAVQSGIRRATQLMAAVLFALSPATHVLAGEPSANPNASPQVKTVLQYLQSLEGKAWLAGQQEVEGGMTRQSDKLFAITGKRPALRGFDIRGDVADPTDETIRWWKQGGLVTFSWHMGAPPEKDSYPNSKGKADVARVLQSGTPENKSFMEKLDTVAPKLQRMQEAGVPVLWRPWHEMNGNWFWWSKSGPEEFKRLWIFMYDYYTKEKKLNNLIWVWSGSFMPSRDWYPGDAYVDVTGSDVYMSQRKDSDWLKIYQRLKEIAPAKPAALTENDIIPDPDKLSAGGNRFIWFLTWHSRWMDINPPDALKHVFTHPYSITADELPDWGK